MKKTKFLLLFALICMVALVFVACQPEDVQPQLTEKTVCGVVSADTGVVEGAEVAIRSTETKVTTDSQGKYSITLPQDDFDTDSFTLVVKKQGYLDKTITVAAMDFIDGVATIDVTVSTENITVSGEVKEGGAALDSVKVTVSCDADASATTDQQGKYTLTFARPIEQFTVSFSKQYYATVSKTVQEVEKTQVTLNADLQKTAYSVSGNVNHYFFGNLQGVTVAVKDSEFSTTTADDGSFAIQNIIQTELPYTLTFSKYGYQTQSVEITEDKESVNVELVNTPINLGILSPSNKNYSMSTVRDSRGFNFYFTSAQQFAEDDKLCIYIDVNETGDVLNGSSVMEFALLGNANCLLWNLKKGHSVTEDAEILWGDEVKYTLVNDQDGAKIHAFISYDTFAKAGEEFAVTDKSVVGITFFDRGTSSKNACGWDRTDMLGIDNAAWVNPETPKDYVRFAPENIIYEADNNNYIAYGNYTVNITVKDEAGNNVAATVKAIYPTEQTINATDGVYSYTLGDIYFNKVARFEISAEDYVTQNINAPRNLFTNGIASLNVTLQEVPDILAETGNVTYCNGALQNATVSVKGHEGTVATDENGNYDLSSLNIELNGATTYTLVVTKEGYDSKEVSVTVGTAVGQIYMTPVARNLGKFGRYSWDVTIDRDETKLVIDLVSDVNWYGMKDLDGNATVTENELQIYFVTDLTQKTKTVDGLRELTIVEKQDRNLDNWAGWRNGNRDFINWPSGIVYSVTNDDNGCKVHVEVAYSLLGIDKTSTIGLAIGEWYGIEGGVWTCPFYDGTTQQFITSGWACDVNNPSTSLHWAADNSTKVEYVA